MSGTGGYQDFPVQPDSSTAGPSGSRRLSGPRRGLGFLAPGEDTAGIYGDGVQHSTAWGLNYGTGELQAYPTALYGGRPLSAQDRQPVGGPR